MFITKKKFRRKTGIKRFYYVMKNVKTDGKHKLKNVKYLGDVKNILQKFKMAKEHEKCIRS